MILAASGAGKSSFLRAGLIPRLVRDDRHFVTLPVVRPGRAVLTGETGVVASLEAALRLREVAKTRSHIRGTLDAGAGGMRALLDALVAAAGRPLLVDEIEASRPRPIIVLPVDQSEELFLPEDAGEAQRFLDSRESC